METEGHTRGNKSMTGSARRRVNRNARRLVEYVLHASGLRRRDGSVIGLPHGEGCDAATLRVWAGRYPQVGAGSGVMSVVGEVVELVDVNWEYAAELMNRQTRSFV